MVIITTFYKFVELSELELLRSKLLQLCEGLAIKGSILIAPEGVNGTVCGSEESISRFRIELDNDPHMSGMTFKRSEHSSETFRRMVVRIKKEIITMRKGGIDPNHLTGKYVQPLELKKWIDEGEDLVFLDTRNHYEVKLGTFRGAIDPNISTFSEFPSYIDHHIDTLKNKKIITFCTGGIRCEKATAYMVQKGLQDTYQIDGGILKYFEDTKDLTSDNHWDGECVVFDKRLAVTKNLETTKAKLCFSCFSPSQVSEEEGLCFDCLEYQKNAAIARFKKGREKYAENLVKRTNHLNAMRRQMNSERQSNRDLPSTLQVESGND